MQSGNPQDLNRDRNLEELFQGYRDACPDFEAGADFMPQMWARIEAQEASTNWFGNIARGLVTAALAASVILGLIVSSMNQSTAFFNGTFVDALVTDNTAHQEPMRLDRISELEMVRQ